ncbi:sigma 54-interacting transcriptional regulator [candidate division KSB1 bacterium]|nr:sigma 54-interacting transcriptional regulator [candidate division KSB1 bacterium]
MRKLLFFLKKWHRIFICFVICLLFTLTLLPRLQQPVDDFCQQIFMDKNLHHPVKILYFDEESIKQLGGWPIPRNIYAYLIYQLNQLHVVTIGVDIFFPTIKGELDENDRFLVEINRQYDNIINSYYLSNQHCELADSILIDSVGIAPAKQFGSPFSKIELPFHELLLANPKAGFSNLIQDNNGTIRAAQLIHPVGEKLLPSFTLKIALHYSQKITKNPTPLSILRKKIQPAYQINYKMPAFSLESCSALDFIKTFNQSTDSLRQQFENSIVIISILSENFGSYKSVPIGSNYPVAGIHAQIVDNILNNDFLRPLDSCWQFILLAIFVFIFISITKYTRRIKYLIILGLAGFFIFLYFVLFSLGIIFPVVATVLFLILMALRVFIEHYQAERHELTQVIHQKKLLADELSIKLTRLSELENQLQSVHENELKSLEESIRAYRSEIQSLKKQINDQQSNQVMVKKFSTLQKLFPEIIFAENSPINDVLMKLERMAPASSPVLILGESGTGKELVAQAIHRLSARPKAQFFAFNCAAFPENLIESELFGHEKGAFTGAIQSKKGLFEIASGGTLFLDEIAETSLAFQAKLLRVVQEKEFYRVGGTKVMSTDARLIAATNRDLKQAMQSGTFRTDLFYRLSILVLEIPPLRERKMDIPLLVQHFLKDNPKNFSVPAMDLLQKYRWPGNVRELQNLVQRSVLLSEGSIVSAEWLQNNTELDPFIPQKPDTLAEQILAKLREKEFKFSAIAEIGQELGNIHRSTITEHLKGIIFKAFYETNFSIPLTIRKLNPHPNDLYAQRLENRICTYLRNVQENISPELTLDENINQRKSQFKNLPQTYHFYLEEIIRGYLEGKWK